MVSKSHAWLFPFNHIAHISIKRDISYPSGGLASSGRNEFVIVFLPAVQTDSHWSAEEVYRGKFHRPSKILLSLRRFDIQTVWIKGGLKEYGTAKLWLLEGDQFKKEKLNSMIEFDPWNWWDCTSDPTLWYFAASCSKGPLNGATRSRNSRALA